MAFSNKTMTPMNLGPRQEGLCFINGEPAALPQRDFLLFHGSSVFTTLRSLNGQPVYWERHWQRVSTHAAFFNYKLPHEQLVLHLFDRAHKELGSNLKLRVIIMGTHFTVTAELFEPPMPSVYLGISVHLSTQLVHCALSQMKTGNSLPYQLAYAEASKHGAHEGLLCNSAGFLVDGSRTSLIEYTGDSLTALQGGLEGIMRQAVMEKARAMGIKTALAFKKPHEVRGQLLLASSLQGLLPVGAPQDETIKKLILEFEQTK